MADFLAALRKGLAAHQAAEKERNEVVEVLREFKRQIYLGTDRQVMVVEALVDDTGETLLLAGQPSNRTPDISMTLASYQLGEEVYPVTVKWQDIETSCADRSALETVLEVLLQNPKVGGIIAAAATGKPSTIPAPSVSVQLNSRTE